VSTHFTVAAETFRPVATAGVRWLAPQADYYRYEQMLLTRGVVPPSYDAWLDWHAQGYGFAAFVRAGTVLSVGTVLRQPGGDWQIAGVRTLDGHTGQGHATAVASFLTAYILAEHDHAACDVPEDCPAMRRIVERLGYVTAGVGS
jgi:hypothetical protein